MARKGVRWCVHNSHSPSHPAGTKRINYRPKGWAYTADACRKPTETAARMVGTHGTRQAVKEERLEETIDLWGDQLAQRLRDVGQALHRGPAASGRLRLLSALPLLVPAAVPAPT